jgi:pilus assembly protein CpaF
MTRSAGSDSGCGTLHANAPADVPRRFDALGALAGLPRDAIQTQLASAVEAVVHLVREGGERRVASISVLRWTGAETVCDLALDAVPGRDVSDHFGPGWPALASLTGVDPC